ncbi:MAG: hypothetical protein WCC14_06805 [Acidobacteriaceae bacterium]
MRKLTLLLAAFVLVPFCFAAAQAAQDGSAPSLPGIVAAGLDAYHSGGADQAMRAWLRNSPLDGSNEASTQAQQLYAAQHIYGNYRGFEPIGIKSFAPGTRAVYLVLDYDSGPLFARFLLYRSGAGWIVTSLAFNPDPNQVLPVDMQ